jgi:hypothetical protein
MLSSASSSLSISSSPDSLPSLPPLMSSAAAQAAKGRKGRWRQHLAAGAAKSKLDSSHAEFYHPIPALLL